MRAWTARRLGVGAFGLACVVLVFGSISVQRMADLGEATQSVDRTLVLREETEVFLSLLTLGGLAVAFGLLVAAGLLLNSAVVERERAARTTAQALAAALAESEAWLRVTLTSIGDGVVATDEHGRVKLMNRVAESLTGWNEDDATGRALADVFVIVNEQSRRPVPNPADKVLRDRRIAGLANHTILIAKDVRFPSTTARRRSWPRTARCSGSCSSSATSAAAASSIVSARGCSRTSRRPAARRTCFSRRCPTSCERLSPPCSGGSRCCAPA
jgi:PAS domain-containing protein